MLSPSDDHEYIQVVCYVPYTVALRTGFPALLREACGPFYSHGVTLIPARISNYMPGKVWDGITYPFLNLNGCTVEV